MGGMSTGELMCAGVTKCMRLGLDDKQVSDSSRGGKVLGWGPDRFHCLVRTSVCILCREEHCVLTSGRQKGDRAECWVNLLYKGLILLMRKQTSCPNCLLMTLTFNVINWLWNFLYFREDISKLSTTSEPAGKQAGERKSFHTTTTMSNQLIQRNCIVLLTLQT